MFLDCSRRRPWSSSRRVSIVVVCAMIPSMWPIWRPIWAKRLFSISGVRCAAGRAPKPGSWPGRRAGSNRSRSGDLLPSGGGSFLRVKAIEALGRVQAQESASTLKRIVEAKKVFGWVQPLELRIAALQALDKLDPDWVQNYLPKSGIDKEDFTLAPLEIPPSSRFV